MRRRFGWLGCLVLAHLPWLERRLIWEPLQQRLDAERANHDQGGSTMHHRFVIACSRCGKECVFDCEQSGDAALDEVRETFVMRWPTAIGRYSPDRDSYPGSPQVVCRGCLTGAERAEVEERQRALEDVDIPF